jgi:hypothetical protein
MNKVANKELHYDRQKLHSEVAGLLPVSGLGRLRISKGIHFSRKLLF